MYPYHALSKTPIFKIGFATYMQAYNYDAKQLCNPENAYTYN